MARAKAFVVLGAGVQSVASSAPAGSVIVHEMTNGRCGHSGSAVVESIAPSFRKRFG